MLFPISIFLKPVFLLSQLVHVKHDEQEFERSKLYRPVAKPQVSEGNALKGINGHTYRHHSDEFGGSGIAQHVGYRGEKSQYSRAEHHSYAPHRDEGGGVDAHLLRFVGGLVDEAEEGGLHAESQEHQQQGHIAVNLGDDPIAATRSSKLSCIEWYEQVVEKTPYDAAQSVDGSFFG